MFAGSGTITGLRSCTGYKNESINRLVIKTESSILRTRNEVLIPATLGAGFILDRLTTPRAVPDLGFFSPRPCLLLIGRHM